MPAAFLTVAKIIFFFFLSNKTNFAKFDIKQLLYVSSWPNLNTLSLPF